MRKTSIVLALVAGGILAAGWQEDSSSQQHEDYTSSVVSDIREQAAEELKKAFIDEIDAFFKSDSQAGALVGIDGYEQEQMKASVEEYIEDFSADEEKIEEARKSLEELFENAQGLSTEELQDKIAGIFGN